jgi:hypothetical protein
VGVTRAGFSEASGGGRGGGGGASSAGQGESPFAGLEVLAFGEGQDGVVAEDGGGGVVQHGVERGAAKGVVELGALLLAHVRSEVEGPVDFGRQELGELVVAEEEGFQGRRGIGSACGSGPGKVRAPPRLGGRRVRRGERC